MKGDSSKDAEPFQHLITKLVNTPKKEAQNHNKKDAKSDTKKHRS